MKLETHEKTISSKDYHAHMDRLLDKECEEILKQLESDPETTSAIAPDHIKEKLDAIISGSVKR